MSARVKLAFKILSMMAFMFMQTHQAFPLDIRAVTSSSGASAWLAESRHLSIIVVDFALVGVGSASDPDDKQGLASFAAQMLLEGAGEFDAKAFQEQLADIGATITFVADRDAMVGRIEVAREHRNRAFDLLRLVLSQPRFDLDAVERVRIKRDVELARLDNDPAYVASRAWWEAAFLDHPYRYPPLGSREANGRVMAADLRNFRSRLSNAKLVVAAAGDVSAAELADLLDRSFRDLSRKGGATPLTMAEYRIFAPVVVRLPFPQSACVFGQPGISPTSAEYLPLLMLNHILGGGTLTSRLFVQLRERRGLVYSIRTAPETLSQADLLIGRFATENAKTKEAIETVRAEWRRAARGDISDEEIAAAKSYLKDMLPVSMDGTSAISAKLLTIQRMEQGIDYIQQWRKRIESIEPELVRRTAKTAFSTDLLTFAIAGKPDGF
jgi:zinc protease